MYHLCYFRNDSHFSEKPNIRGFMFLQYLWGGISSGTFLGIIRKKIGMKLLPVICVIMGNIAQGEGSS